MNSTNTNLITENQIGLSLDSQSFAKVILDFLGHKEKLSYHSEEGFILNFEDINQFNHLIKSKIHYHKNVVLDHFSVIFGYEDGTSREINGEEALNAFLETRSLEVVSTNLSWKIIIKFDNHPTIETQKIDILFLRDKELKDIPAIFISIDHTNQSWALDILNALKEKVKEIIIQQK